MFFDEKGILNIDELVASNNSYKKIMEDGMVTDQELETQAQKVVSMLQDLEKKYNFASLLGLKRNVEVTAKGILKLENELNNMLNALVINLKDKTMKQLIQSVICSIIIPFWV